MHSQSAGSPIVATPRLTVFSFPLKWFRTLNFRHIPQVPSASCESCGILANGFARLRCPACGFERLLAFSCKGRLCPSCWARRAADTAAHLVDHVLPEATYRQWVLTFPWEARLFIAIDRQLLSDLLRDFLRTVFAWQRRLGRRAGIAE